MIKKMWANFNNIAYPIISDERYKDLPIITQKKYKPITITDEDPMKRIREVKNKMDLYLQADKDVSELWEDAYDAIFKTIKNWDTSTTLSAGSSECEKTGGE